MLLYSDISEHFLNQNITHSICRYSNFGLISQPPRICTVSLSYWYDESPANLISNIARRVYCHLGNLTLNPVSALMSVIESTSQFSNPVSKYVLLSPTTTSKSFYWILCGGPIHNMICSVRLLTIE